MKNRILISKLKPFSPFYSIPVLTQNFSLIRKIPVYHFSESNTASVIPPPPTESEIFSKSLASLKTVREILNTFDSKKGGITKSEIAILLKVMARMANPEDETNLKNDPTFKKINEEVIRNIDSFNSTGFFCVFFFLFLSLFVFFSIFSKFPSFFFPEILDILFSVRKFKLAKAGFNFSTSDMRKIIEKINSFITVKALSFRSLVNLHYDLSFLGTNTDPILEAISEEINNNRSIVTVNIILQMLQASSQKSSAGLSFREYMTITRLLSFLEEKYSELKIDQKCNLFKYIAKLELKYHTK